MIVTKDLCGLKSVGASFSAFLAEKLDKMNFKYSMADPYVWMWSAIKSDNEEYYEYILVYVDDIIKNSYCSKDIMNEIESTFKFTNDNTSEPEINLGARLQKKSINRMFCWTMSSIDYINVVVKNLDEVTKNKK